MEMYKKPSISNENEIHQILISISIPNCSFTLIYDALLRSTRLRCRYRCLRHLHPPRNTTTMSNCSMQILKRDLAARAYDSNGQYIGSSDGC